ncbi:unnamed protein product [Paramecium pentaurelia]|uniref:Uncharacterized protein n=1 Tax=Paramecium pentaurelia TaxID=43138 RepID=A0A8S1WUH2_9CILI|nr:unnamed protein product [Paramecium pentaurelia]
MEQALYKDIFYNYDHSYVNDYLTLQEEYVRPWQVNVERVQHGQNFGVKVPSMTSLVQGLMDKWEVEQKKKMRLLNLGELQNKILELEQQYDKINDQCKSILAQKFNGVQMQSMSDKKAPLWVEVQNSTEEEEFLDTIYIKWCTIQPFNQELQNAAKAFQLYNPQTTIEICVNENNVQPLHIQFFLGAKFTRYSTNQRCKYEFNRLESYKINFIQVPYDKGPYIRLCKRCGFTTNEPSVKLEDDVKHLLQNCAIFAQYIGRDQLQINR